MNFQELLSKADSGDIGALLEIASASYMRTEYGEENTRLAIDWLMDAGKQSLIKQELINRAKSGDAKMMYVLSLVYHDAEYGQKNNEQSLYWMEKAAESGYVNAQLSMAAECIDKNDYNNYFRWVEKASNLGNSDAKVELAICYGKGAGVSKNEAKAAQLLKEAAEQGNETAKDMLRKMPGGSSGSSGGCYVATCIYGSYDCPEVWTLRRFRDDTLQHKWLGKKFIRTYYRISPKIVKWFGSTVWFNRLTKPIIEKLVNKLQSNGVESSPYYDR